MQFPHQHFQFFHRIPGCAVRCFRRKIICFSISPVIDPLTHAFTDRHMLFRRMFFSDLGKFIYWHQQKLCNTQFFQVGNLFPDASKGSRMTDTGTWIHSKSPDMGFVQHTLFHRQCQRMIPCPRKRFKPGLAAKLFFFHRFSPDLSSPYECRIGILYDFSVYLIVVFIFLHRQTFQPHGTDLSESHIICETQFQFRLVHTFPVQ